MESFSTFVWIGERNKQGNQMTGNWSTETIFNDSTICLGSNPGQTFVVKSTGNWSTETSNTTNGYVQVSLKLTRHNKEFGKCFVYTHTHCCVCTRACTTSFLYRHRGWVYRNTLKLQKVVPKSCLEDRRVCEKKVWNWRRAWKMGKVGVAKECVRPPAPPVLAGRKKNASKLIFFPARAKVYEPWFSSPWMLFRVGLTFMLTLLHILLPRAWCGGVWKMCKYANVGDVPPHPKFWLRKKN